MTLTPANSSVSTNPPTAEGLSHAGRFMRLLSRLFHGALSEYSVLILAAIYFLVTWTLIPDLATAENLANLLVGMLPLLALAIGQTVVLITGGIDLSMTAIIGATSVLSASIANDSSGLLAHHPAAVPIALLAAVALGALIGLANGSAISLLKMPPFIVTLSMMMCLSGTTLWLTHSRNIANLPDGFIALGYGRVLGIPRALLIVLGLAVIVHVLLRFTLPGRWLYAIGQNARTSRVSGVPVRGVTTMAYAISGICAAVGSILLNARLETGSPTQGDKMLLDIIGASVIGGTSLTGGRGKVVWAFFGVLLFSLIANTLELLNLQHFTIMMIKGGVILLAAGLDVMRRRLLAGS